jgi:basic membrane protein A
MKKNLLGIAVITIILSLCLSSVVFAGGEPIKVGIVTDVGGRGDRSFNDSAIRGLETWAAKVKYVQGGGYEPLSDEEFMASIPEDLTDAGIYSMNVVPIVLESKDKKDYIPNISTLIEQAHCDLVIGVGFMLAGAIGESAIKYPDTKFMLVDGLPVDETGTVVELQNVVGYLFNEHECGFLVGAIAGYATKANKVGYIGGMPIPPVLRYEAGYWAGVKTINPNAAIYVQYTGSFTEPALGKSSAESQISQGCDILFHAAGATGNGMFQSICEKGAPYWGIGVDVDMGLDPNLCPDRTLTSALKHLDYATYLIVKSVVDDKFQSGVKIMTLKDGGVTYAPDHVKDALTQQQIDKVENLRQMIIDGKVIVPQDPKDVKAWNPPTDF